MTQNIPVSGAIISYKLDCILHWKENFWLLLIKFMEKHHIFSDFKHNTVYYAEIHAYVLSTLHA